MAASSLYGGIEGGGTKFVCAVGNSPAELVQETSFPTTTPQETLNKVVEFFSSYIQQGAIKAIGLGSFGPVDIDPASPHYGYITTTPKPGWAYTNILGILAQELGVPIAMDMDVVASAMGEHRWGASQAFSLSLYLTVGTGIGGSYVSHGKPMRGLVSLEMGHVRIPHDHQADPFQGSCPYHGDCFEGLASGPALSARFSMPGDQLSSDDPFWEIEAGYIAAALADYIFTFPPEIIVLGGGVMHRRFLYPKIREKVSHLLNNYLSHPRLTSQLDEYIVQPALEYRSGVFGAIALAIDLENQHSLKSE